MDRPSPPPSKQLGTTHFIQLELQLGFTLSLDMSAVHSFQHLVITGSALGNDLLKGFIDLIIDNEK